MDDRAFFGVQRLPLRPHVEHGGFTYTVTDDAVAIRWPSDPVKRELAATETVGDHELADLPADKFKILFPQG